MNRPVLASSCKPKFIHRTNNGREPTRNERPEPRSEAMAQPTRPLTQQLAHTPPHPPRRTATATAALSTSSPHPTATLAVTALATTVALMNYTSPLTTVPDISAALATGASGQAWLINGTPLGLAAFLLVVGSLADDYGSTQAVPHRHPGPRRHHRRRRLRDQHARLHAGPRGPGRGHRGDPRDQPWPARRRVPHGSGQDQGDRDLGRVREWRDRARPAAHAARSARSTGG